MKVTPKTKEELEMDGLLPPGVYPFRVESSEAKTSKAGNEMIKLGIRLYGGSGRDGYTFHYLMDKMPQHLAQFCRFTGMEALYDSGNVEPEDCLGREGWVKVGIEKASGNFPAKNAIDCFCPEPSKTDSGQATKTGEDAAFGSDDGDEIPF